MLVARGDTILYETAYGLADRAQGIPNTRFNLASLDKMFTGVAVMQLVERGLLSVDIKVGDVLPDYPHREVASQVKVHQLLTHTSASSAGALGRRTRSACTSSWDTRPSSSPTWGRGR